MRLHQLTRQALTAVTGPESGRFGLMLILLVLFLLLTPLLSGSKNGYLALEPVLYAILLNSMRVAGLPRKAISITLVALCLLYALRIAGAIAGSSQINAARLAYAPVLLFITLIFVTKGIVTSQKVTMGVIYGAVSAYFLVALLWAFLYLGIETAWPGSFAINAGETNLTVFSYYSFVTTTTLGYGDIVPLREYPRLFAAIEAFTGQVYVAVTIARLVALQISQSGAPGNGNPSS